MQNRFDGWDDRHPRVGGLYRARKPMIVGAINLFSLVPLDALCTVISIKQVAQNGIIVLVQHVEILIDGRVLTYRMSFNDNWIENWESVQ